MMLCDNYKFVGKKIIEEYGIEPISQDVDCIFPIDLQIYGFYLDVPMFVSLYNVNDYNDYNYVDNTKNKFKPMNYEGYIIRLSYTPHFLYLYYWPGTTDYFFKLYHDSNSSTRSNDIHKILRYLKSNYVSFMDKYKLK